MLNDDKTEFLLLGTKQQLAKVDVNSITVGESVVNTKPVVKNLGSWFDSQQRKLSFIYITSLSHIRKFLSPWCMHSLLLTLTTAITVCMVYLPHSLTIRFSMF